MKDKIISRSEFEATDFNLSEVIDDIDETTLLKDQLKNTQVKLKTAFERYEELYKYSEEILKQHELEKSELLKAIKTAEDAKELTGVKLDEHEAALVLRDNAIKKLQEREQSLIKNASKLAPVVKKTIQSLTDLHAFVDNCAARFTPKDNPLAPKGAKIMLEQIHNEIEGLQNILEHLQN